MHFVAVHNPTVPFPNQHDALLYLLRGLQSWHYLQIASDKNAPDQPVDCTQLHAVRELHLTVSPGAAVLLDPRQPY